MPYLDHTDLKNHVNIDLTASNGEALADTLANAILAWAERRIGHAIPRGTTSEFFDEGGALFTPSAPVNVSGVIVETYNYNISTKAYDAYPTVCALSPMARCSSSPLSAPASRR